MAEQRPEQTEGAQPEPPPRASHPEVAIQAKVIESLSRAVQGDASWRWLEVGCPLASGRGDRLSDVDAAVGYADQLVPSRFEAAGLDLVEAGGDVLDVLIHRLPGAPPDTRRFAVEYGSGVQLDLLAMPAKARIGHPEGDIAVVDKDGVLADRWKPTIADPPTVEQAREWAMPGWWAISDAAKFLRRGSFFEAVERVAEARQHALRLFAASRRIPYCAFGLVSLLDVTG